MRFDFHVTCCVGGHGQQSSQASIAKRHGVKPVEMDILLDVSSE